MWTKSGSAWSLGLEDRGSGQLSGRGTGRWSGEAALRPALRLPV